MSTDQPPPGQSPEDDPFLKKPQEPTPPSGGSPYGSPPPGGGGYPPPPPGGPGGGYPPPPGGGPGGGYPPPPGGGGYPPPPPPYGMPDPLSGMPPLAGFGRRLGARVIDLILVGIPLALIQLPFGTKRYVVDTSRGEDVSEVITKSYNGTGLLWTLISIVAYVGYDWYLTHRSNGQTVGKKALGLRVAMLDDGRVPPSNAALGRAAALWIPTLVCCFCLWPLALIVSMLVDKPYKQALHDKVARTVVVVAA
ncbi:RDD family protein [Streptomyces sp. NPDC029216]|uniref:RDD family protein n=1 Tax=Streptomyces sp. NPDC029216 TaxID=3154701 RepID=UPI0033E2870D